MTLARFTFIAWGIAIATCLYVLVLAPLGQWLAERVAACY